ncbi:hypothetical protein ABMA27_008057 [Loxostege sticticalis]|uniref:Uncharacterized protein n=1 Tax=Loxostege sticticalis TaxID=481309 RepID=A0ABR3HDU3_LOXSC
MTLLTIFGLVLLLTKSSLETHSKYAKSDIMDPTVSSMTIHKRDAGSSKGKVKELYDVNNDFIEEKLVEHGQALEHLVVLVQNNEELTRKLVDKLSNFKTGEKPELPEKVEVLNFRRKNSAKSKIEENVAENPFVRLSKNLPKYGLLLKDLVLKQDGSADPRPLLPSRRSFGHDDLSAALHGERGSPWCIAAFLCRKTGTKVCGFDSGYGYGRFKDICHMFDVNCYWEHNFLLSSECNKLF